MKSINVIGKEIYEKYVMYLESDAFSIFSNTRNGRNEETLNLSGLLNLTSVEKEVVMRTYRTKVESFMSIANESDILAFTCGISTK